MSKIYPPSDSSSKNAHVSSMESYREQYDESISDPEAFWAKTAERLDWIAPWTNVRSFDFVQGKIEWFKDGKLNASYNCIDRHIKNGHGDETAIIWEGNDPNQSRKFTY